MVKTKKKPKDFELQQKHRYVYELSSCITTTRCICIQLYKEKIETLQMAIKVNCRVKENYSKEEMKICHYPNITNSIYFIVM